MNGETRLTELHIRVVEMKVRVWEWHGQWPNALRQLSIDKGDAVSWHQFAHPCIGDTIRVEMHIAWHAFLAVA